MSAVKIFQRRPGDVHDWATGIRTPVERMMSEVLFEGNRW